VTAQALDSDAKTTKDTKTTKKPAWRGDCGGQGAFVVFVVLAIFVSKD
jgi:hypothetical protein